MDQDKIRTCSDILKCFFEEEDLKKKDNLRNKLFLEMQNQMIKWIASILSKHHMYLDRTEIISLSWDSFAFSLDQYQECKTIPIQNHFYSYTKFYLMTHLFKKGEDEEYFDEEDEKYEDVTNIYYHVEDLKAFRDCLDPKYFSVFEDAVLSLVTSRRDRLRRLDESSLDYIRYSEAKKIFKYVIRFLMVR